MVRFHRSLCIRKLAEKRKQEGIDEGETDVNLQTAVEVEDAWEDEREAFTPASRTTGELKNSFLSAPNGATSTVIVVIVKTERVLYYMSMNAFSH